MTIPWTNETEIWINDYDGPETGFMGFSLRIETDIFWNRNFSIWY